MEDHYTEIAISAILDIIESTYSHDEQGHRTDEPSGASCADIVARLVDAECPLRAALELIASDNGHYHTHPHARIVGALAIMPDGSDAPSASGRGIPCPTGEFPEYHP